MKKEKKFYSLQTDLVFKSIFNNEENVKRLLKETLDIEAQTVETIGNEMPLSNVNERGKLLDLVVTSKEKETGRLITSNIEVNRSKDKAVLRRNITYFFKLVSENVKRRQNYLETDDNVQINLTWNAESLLGNVIKGKRKAVFYLMEEETHEKLCPEFAKIIHYNMDYFNDLCYDDGKDKFFWFLSAKTYKEMVEIAKGDELLEKICKQVATLNESEEFLKAIRLENDAEIMKNSLRSEWLAKGEIKGEKRGEKRGKAQGIKQNKLDTAQAMLNDNLPIETIMKYTCLTRNQIEALA